MCTVHPGGNVDGAYLSFEAGPRAATPAGVAVFVAVVVAVAIVGAGSAVVIAAALFLVSGLLRSALLVDSADAPRISIWLIW